MSTSCVYFDLETSGLDPDKHEIIHLAAIAVDRHFRPIETFEVKLHFDIKAADPEALKMNSFDPDVWAREAVQPAGGLGSFGMFLRRHATVELVSKRTGRPYSVARLAGHNVGRFDCPRLQSAFKLRNIFLPAHPIPLDTMQLAAWWASCYLGAHRLDGSVPSDIKLPTLAAFFNVAEEGAHDALIDVRMNVAVARELAIRCNLYVPGA